MDIRFGTQSAKHRTVQASAQEMVNCYLEASASGSKSPVVVVPSHGIANHCSLTSLRGGNRVVGVPYVATAAGLYSVSANGTETLLAPQTFAQDVLIEGDGTNLLLVSGGSGYIWDGSTLAAMPDADFPSAQWMGYLDGYYPTIAQGTGQFFINTTAYDPTAWAPLDFENAAASPDNLVWGVVDKRELILGGTESIEFFYNSGNADFPFTRVPNGFIDIGIYSKYAMGRNSNSAFFMGADGIAYMLIGYTPQRISTHAMEQAIEGYQGECRVLNWTESGHSMVGFKFETACWVFDLTTQLWHTRESYQGSSWDVDFVISGDGQTYLAGGTTLGKITPDTFTDFGAVLRMKVVFPSIYSSKALIPHDRLELDIEAGRGQADVMLRYSDDGGETWSSEIVGTTGNLGDYQNRVIFGPLGSSRDRVYEVAIADAQRRTLMGATLNEWS